MSMKNGLFSGLDEILKKATITDNHKSIKENMDDICEVLETEIVKSVVIIHSEYCSFSQESGYYGEYQY